MSTDSLDAPREPSMQAWQFLARVAKARREFIELSQEELADYGGPRKSTVGKIENARETKYSSRTQQQLEKALGWDRGTFASILRAADDYSPDLLESFAAELIEDNIPDLTRSVGPGDDDEDTLLYRRPAGITDETWRQLRARTRNLVEWEIEQALKETLGDE